MHNLSRNSTKNVKKSKERDKKDNLLILNTPPPKKCLKEVYPPEWLIVCMAFSTVVSRLQTTIDEYWQKLIFVFGHQLVEI